jgi:hypothetical protein
VLSAAAFPGAAPSTHSTKGCSRTGVRPACRRAGGGSPAAAPMPRRCTCQPGGRAAAAMCWRRGRRRRRPWRPACVKRRSNDRGGVRAREGGRWQVWSSAGTEAAAEGTREAPVPRARLAAVRVHHLAARVALTPAAHVVHLALDDQPAVIRLRVAGNLSGADGLVPAVAHDVWCASRHQARQAQAGRGAARAGRGAARAARAARGVARTAQAARTRTERPPPPQACCASRGVGGQQRAEQVRVRIRR